MLDCHILTAEAKTEDERSESPEQRGTAEDEHRYDATVAAGDRPGAFDAGHGRYLDDSAATGWPDHHRTSAAASYYCDSATSAATASGYPAGEHATDGATDTASGS